jgi:hypothetical protein
VDHSINAKGREVIYVYPTFDSAFVFRDFRATDTHLSIDRFALKENITSSIRNCSFYHATFECVNESNEEIVIHAYYNYFHKITGFNIKSTPASTLILTKEEKVYIQSTAEACFFPILNVIDEEKSRKIVALEQEYEEIKTLLESRQKEQQHNTSQTLDQKKQAKTEMINQINDLISLVNKINDYDIFHADKRCKPLRS